MRNQEINVLINNFNLFIREHSAKSASQNMPPRGQQIRAVFAQYRQLPAELHAQVAR